MSEETCFRAALDALAQNVEAKGSVYVVLSGTSESKPVQNFFRTDGLTALPLFMGTSYAGWHDVMPFLAQITTASAFIEWIEESNSTDWGWGLISRAPFDDVFGHIRSLTKITLADGHEVFFRYWAARFFEQVLHSLDEAGRTTLMGPIEAVVLSSGETIHHPGVPEATSPVPSFPWFSLTSKAQKKVAALCWDQLVGNTMAVLAKTKPSPLSRYPEPVARRKVERHVRRLCQSNVPTELEPSQLQSIHQALMQEASMGSRR